MFAAWTALFYLDFCRPACSAIGWLADLAGVACVMTIARWNPEKGRIASEATEMNWARELNRGTCTVMWVSPHTFTSQYPLNTNTTSAISNYNLPTPTVTYFQLTIPHLHLAIPWPHTQHPPHLAILYLSPIFQITLLKKITHYPSWHVQIQSEDFI